MGFADKGAELSWLSQYPHEKEFCFPPLTGLSVRRSRVEGAALVLELLPRVAPTLAADGAADVFYELFIEYDQDNSHALSADEFADLVDEAQRRRGNPPYPPEVAATVFRNLDVDGDGDLKLAEFHPERVHQELEAAAKAVEEAAAAAAVARGEEAAAADLRRELEARVRAEMAAEMAELRLRAEASEPRPLPPPTPTPHMHCFSPC